MPSTLSTLMEFRTGVKVYETYQIFSITPPTG